MTTTVRDPKKLLKQLRKLHRWGGASGSVLGLTCAGTVVEPELHDICHAVTAGIRLPPKGKLDPYINHSLNDKYPRKKERNANEMRTLAVEIHVLEALAVLKNRDRFLYGLSKSLDILDVEDGVLRRYLTLRSARDARRVIRAIRYHSTK